MDAGELDSPPLVCFIRSNPIVAVLVVIVCVVCPPYLRTCLRCSEHIKNNTNPRGTGMGRNKDLLVA